MEKNSKRSKRNIETNHDQLPLCNIATLFSPYFVRFKFSNLFFFLFIILSMRETSILLKKKTVFFFDQNLHIIHLYRNISLLIVFFDTVKKNITSFVQRWRIDFNSNLVKFPRCKIFEKRDSRKRKRDHPRERRSTAFPGHDFHDQRI